MFLFGWRKVFFPCHSIPLHNVGRQATLAYIPTHNKHAHFYLAHHCESNIYYSHTNIYRLLLFVRYIIITVSHSVYHRRNKFLLFFCCCCSLIRIICAAWFAAFSALFWFLGKSKPFQSVFAFGNMDIRYPNIYISKSRICFLEGGKGEKETESERENKAKAVNFMRMVVCELPLLTLK